MHLGSLTLVLPAAPPGHVGLQGHFSAQSLWLEANVLQTQQCQRPGHPDSSQSGSYRLVPSPLATPSSPPLPPGAQQSVR